MLWGPRSSWRTYDDRIVWTVKTGSRPKLELVSEKVLSQSAQSRVPGSDLVLTVFRGPQHTSLL